MADESPPAVTTGKGETVQEACIEWLRQARFGETVTCVYCGSDDLWHRGTTRKGAQRYECQGCERVFNDLTDTVFNNRKPTIEELFYMIRERPAASMSELTRRLDWGYDAVHGFVTAVETTETTFDPAALRAAFADVELIDADRTGTDPGAEQTMIYVEAETRDRLRAWKRERDLTYDAAVGQLLDAIEAFVTNGTSDSATTGGSFGGPNTGGFEQRASVSITKGTRKRLKLWKTREGLTYDGAIRQLLAAAATEA